MSLRDQYQALFHIVYDEELQERFLSNPRGVLKERGLAAEEIRPLAEGRLERLRAETMGRRAFYLKLFFNHFPRTTYLLTSACESLRPLNDFFTTPYFLDCFSGDESFVSAFSDFLAQTARHYAGLVPSLPDLHAYEEALSLLRARPRANGHDSPPGPMSRSRRLVQAPHIRLRRFTYPITQVVEYIDTFTAGSWYGLAPLWAAAGERLPKLLIPHQALPEPMSTLLLLEGDEFRVLKIKAAQYEALAACDGTRNYDEVLETVAVSVSDPQRLIAWLNYCWQRRLIIHSEE